MILDLFSRKPSNFVFIVFFALLIFSSCTPENKEPQIALKTERVDILDANDIISIRDSLVRPILYSGVSGLDELPLDLKKEKFISALLPAILVVKEKLKRKAEHLSELTTKQTWSQMDSVFFQGLTAQFKTDDMDKLKSALTTHPNSIVLAQAAVESGWGNSRFFAEANNLFGIWSYNKNEPRIPARINRGNDTVYLRKYEDISQSIENYFITLGRSAAYKDFRENRLESDNPYDLIPYLRLYSERRESYVAQLRTMIKYNDLSKYDAYQLDPESFVEVIE